jgi:long-subunit acyl-CoA synthetase (AMP-forming)
MLKSIMTSNAHGPLMSCQRVELEKRAHMQMLAAGWGALGMVGRGDFVGIIGFASMDWLVSDIAATYVGSVMAPLPTNILLEDIQHLIIEAEVSIPSGSCWMLLRTKRPCGHHRPRIHGLICL